VIRRWSLWTPSLKARVEPFLSRWAPCPNGAPDVAHSSWEFPEGTGVGESRNPSDLVSQGLDPKTSSPLLRLRFHVRNGLPRAISASAIQKDNGWDAVVWKGRLYVLVDVTQMNDSGSKEAFVSLLEYAEEVLECSHVIVCFEKCQSTNTKTAIRNFLFLGFQPLAPGHEYLPTNPNLVCFLYAI
jgi:ornithine decarboxylase antizyme 1